MNTNEIEEVEEMAEEFELGFKDIPEGCTTTTRIQRKRNVQYLIADETTEGLALLVSKVGPAAIVRLYQEKYIARNSLLSRMDKEDGKGFEGEYTLPDQESDTVIYFNLLENLPKPGSKKSKWGNLKPYVEQAKDMLAKNGEKDASEERVRVIAGRLKEVAEKAKVDILG